MRPRNRSVPMSMLSFDRRVPLIPPQPLLGYTHPSSSGFRQVDHALHPRFPPPQDRFRKLGSGLSRLPRLIPSRLLLLRERKLRQTRRTFAQKPIVQVQSHTAPYRSSMTDETLRSRRPVRIRRKDGDHARPGREEDPSCRRRRRRRRGRVGDHARAIRLTLTVPRQTGRRRRRTRRISARSIT